MSATAEVEVLPWLPQGWLDGIAAGDYVERARGTVRNYRAAMSWFKKRPDAKGEPCKQMQAALDKGLENLEESSSGAAHDELTQRVYQLASLAVEGHRGAYTAVRAVGEAFVDEVTHRRRSAVLAGEAAGSVRSEGEAQEEVERAVRGAVRLMKGHLEQPEMVEAGLGNGSAGCPCWDEPIGSEGGRAMGPQEYPYTDTGNAEHLIDLVDGNMLWVPAMKEWYGYKADQGLWEMQDADYGMQMARRIAPRVKMAAEQHFKSSEMLHGEEQETTLKTAINLHKHAEKCGSASALREMLNVAKSYPEAVSKAEAFDANPRLLHCPDGSVIELKEDGVDVRAAARDDRGTRATASPYVPGATDPAWVSYLDTFIPDLELRWYVQRLLGYSLLGANPLGRLVFLHGPTSSGKSTLVEAVNAAMGSYAGTFDLSLFREKQDAGARPDIVRSLPLRALFTSEASSAWNLHNDQIKSMTGGDTKVARLNFGNHYFEGVPAFTPFIATNAFPQINNADAATWRRLQAIPFDVQVTGKDVEDGARDYIRTDPGALQAVLAWLVEGYRGYATEGLKDVPEPVRKRTNEMKGEVSDFHSWFFDACELGEEYYVETGKLYESYRMTMLANSCDARDIMSNTKFGKALQGQGIAKSKVETIDGKNARWRRGVRFRMGVDAP